MDTLTQTRMTVEEYLAWANGRDGHYELVNGEVKTMPSELLRHVQTKYRVFFALERAIENAGVACYALGDGVTVKIDARTAYGPDALLYCGEEIADDAMIVPEPVIVVEVLSESTRRKDMTVKATGYFSLPSVAHYLIVDAEARTIEHRERGREPRIVTEGALDLTPPGITLALSDIFPA